MGYSGVDPTNPIDASSGQANASSTSVVAPSVDVSGSGAVLVSLVGVAANGSVTPPASMTERVDVSVGAT
jgi:hypothetical protein